MDLNNTIDRSLIGLFEAMSQNGVVDAVQAMEVVLLTQLYDVQWIVQQLGSQDHTLADDGLQFAPNSDFAKFVLEFAQNQTCGLQWASFDHFFFAVHELGFNFSYRD